MDEGKIFYNDTEETGVETPEPIEDADQLSEWRSVLSSQLPIPTLDDFRLQLALQENQSDAASLNEEQESYAIRLKRDADSAFKSIALQLSEEVDLPVGEIASYVAKLISFNNEIRPSPDHNFHFLKTWAKIAPSNADLTFWEEQWALWNERSVPAVDSSNEPLNREFDRVAVKLSGVNILPRPEHSHSALSQLLGVSRDAINFKHDELWSKFSDKAVNTFENSVLQICRDSGDPKRAEIFVETTRQLVTLITDETEFERVFDCIYTYARTHPLRPEMIIGFIRKLLPAIRQQDPEVWSLLRKGNRWGMKEGDFGVADFQVHCFTQKIAPEAVSELVYISRTIPSTEENKVEQNRLDALRLAGPFGILRDFIHDQRPHVHELIAGMVHYYDTNGSDASSLNSAIAKSDYFNHEYQQNQRESLKDLNNYNLVLDSRGGSASEKTIAILRRIEENTRPTHTKPPTVTNSDLNVRLKAIEQAENDGVSGLLRRDQVVDTVRWINTFLRDEMSGGEVGISPGIIKAISWIERKCFGIIQRLDFEQQMGARKQQWFTDILLFHELTSTLGPFDEADFNNFLRKLQSDNFDDIAQPNSAAQAGMIQAHRLLGSRIIQQVGKLKDYYVAHDYDPDYLWSGNLTHELMGFSDLRPASTAAGENYRRDMISENNPSI